MKKLTLTLCFLVMASTANAMVTDWPHNETNNIGCTDCHSYSFWWQFSPVNSDPQIWEEKTSAICSGCHDGVKEVFAAPHSKFGMGNLHNSDISEWSRACVACHDPHFQAQLNWYGDPNVPNNELFVMTATIAGLAYDVSTDTTNIVYSNVSSGNHPQWQNNFTDWVSKSGTDGRPLVMALPITTPANGNIEPGLTMGIIAADATTIKVPGMLDLSYAGAEFGLLYGQLIKDSIDGGVAKSSVKFFDPYGGFVDSSGNGEGLCQVCHTQTAYFNYDDNVTVVLSDHLDKKDPDQNVGAEARCTFCHTHDKGFAPGSSGGQHPLHLAMTGNCNMCHTNGIPDPLTEKGCNTCHNNGRGIDPTLSGTEGVDYLTDAEGNKYGLPNDMSYRSEWRNLAVTYSLNCNSCHNGRLNLEDVADTANYTHSGADGKCDVCHTGHQPDVAPDGLCTWTSGACLACHDGNGTNGTNNDFQEPAVGMQTGGHVRLASSKWIRQYDCFYCHAETVSESYTLMNKHVNQTLNVDIERPQWAVVDKPDPKYTYNTPLPGETANTCYNVYCHTDGTTLQPEMRPYPWNGGVQDCNSCHGHAPGTNCTPCHTDGRSWENYPDKKWLSAMPMYPNTGPRTDKANSHYRHLFTGFSCDDCHFDTIAGGSCIDCHSTTIPTGSMNEESHINPKYHVNRSKNVVFKDGGTYDPTNKSCDNTACHTGYEPEWGGSVYDSVVCRKCHGVTDADVDDFGKFNDTRAKIDLTQWNENGHGRQGTVDPVTFASDNPYPSGNPPANFPNNGCWYCHDSRVLHQDEERPFRLIQHDHFANRFEKECVFCHMTGEDNECLECHNASESLAPQLATIISPEDHSGYVDGQTSCVNSCHIDDATRHRTEAGEWTTVEKDDVRNAYVQMGVCLKCHDDDSGGQCESCHTGPQYALGFDPADFDTSMQGKTAGLIVPKKAKASSFHFGYKHFSAFMASEAVELDAGSVDFESTSTREVVDTSKVGVWTDDQFTGRRVTITSGVNAGLTRPIIRNSVRVEGGVDVAVLTVAPPFPDGQQLKAGDNYKILDHVWKGGKFCWDCHDPHGDDNIYMIQNQVATRTDGVVGKPITRKQVSFTRKSTGTDYVDLQEDPQTGAYNGICNVCHTDPSMHYTANSSDGHNSSRVCTECHEHRFTNSHASKQECNTCHANRPVPRHTAFGQARDCTKCHKDAINARMNIMAQFSANSHHVQGDQITNKHCYACHWEATPEGVINIERHAGYNYKTHSSTKNAEVDLVIWGDGVRPTVYDADRQGGNDTAVTFLAKDIDVWSAGTTSNLAKQRAQVDNITDHCLGCHSDKNNDTMPFNVVDPENGDCKTPRQYAWDRNSIEARYSDDNTTTFGKYAGPNASEKVTLTKAFSAHGNAVSGGGGWTGTDGEDQDIIDSRSGAYNIQCFDCHSSHGSMVTGVTSSYTTFNGTRNGANLKETQAGKGGYTMTYKATANPNPNTINPYQAGAGQCFDCHDTPTSNTQVSVSSKTPWGYNDTFEADAPIRGYRDSERFGEGDRGVNDRFAYKPTALAGGHFKASHKNTASRNYDPSGSSDLNPMGTIDGLCTPCHDPHGISPSLGADAQYATPLLKGTWMTSPYKEDSPDTKGTTTAENYYSNNRGNFGSIKPMQQQADGRGTGAWRTDRNTFNNGDLSLEASHPDQYNRVAEGPEQFAGLCLRCHPKDSLTTDINPADSATLTENLTWKTKDRIHRSVKGWGWSEGDDEREHSFTCSKCHSAHVSGLPRLMKTNCLNYSHRGLQQSGSVPGSGSNYYGKFPYGFWTPGTFDNQSTATCHGADTANGSTGWPANQSWNDVTPWEGQ